MYDSLRPHGLQNASLPCPSPTLRVCSNLCPLNQWCHPTISSSVIPFSHLQSFPASVSFQMSQLFVSSGQNIGVSASISVFPMTIQDGFPLGLTGWVSLKSKELSRAFSNTAIQKQRHYFDNKGLSSQSYGFFSSQVWMWELDYKESWAPKNWCFWTVVLEKTLESPLDCKDIQPVHPKGNQPWIFIGRTDAEAETPILWPPDVKKWLIGKDPDAGEDWRQEEKETTEDEMVGWHHQHYGHEFG